jgi:hypothetical protein
MHHSALQSDRNIVVSVPASSRLPVQPQQIVALAISYGIQDLSNRHLLERIPLFLLFLQEIISEGTLLRRRNPRSPAAQRAKKQRDKRPDTGSAGCSLTKVQRSRDAWRRAPAMGQLTIDDVRMTRSYLSK